jgi:hypothetical protein
MLILPTRSRLRAASLALTLLAIVAAGSAMAADAVFPTGSRIGIVPPASMAQSRNFIGFEDPQKNAAILFTMLPAKAFETLDKSMTPDAMKKDGVDIEKREPITLGAGNGFLLTGTQTGNTGRYRKWLLVMPTGNITALVTIQVPEQDTTYSEKTMRDALATVAVRDSVPDAEQLSLMPFAIGDMAGFRVDEAMPGRAVMLVDRGAGSADQSKDQNKDASSFNARFLIAAMPGGPAQPSDRSNFARTIFQQIIGIKEVQVQDAEPMRIGTQQGFETLAKAKDIQTNADLMVVQWLRFGSSGFLQMVGMGRADTWPTVFNRMRAIRDSIDPK